MEELKGSSLSLAGPLGSLAGQNQDLGTGQLAGHGQVVEPR